MILQELLRNYLLYRGVLRPLLESWRDSFMMSNYSGVVHNPSAEISLALKQREALGGGEELGWDMSDEYEAKSIAHTSGTHTITSLIILHVSGNDHFYAGKNDKVSASVGRINYIVLMDDRYAESVEVVGKTYNHSAGSSLEISIQNQAKTINTTTGFESIQINSFLSLETHEKREYLGEFSLTHEETPLFIFKKGGE